jgi:type I restriction enzyme, S subunit
VSQWPMVRLGDVLHLRIDAEKVDPTRSYPFAGVYSFGRGLFARGEQRGDDTTYKVFHRLHANDYVISQPKAWEGAIARVSAEFEGWYLSPVFPTFRVRPDHLLPEYLEWFGKLQTTWKELRFRAKGMGARRESVSPEQFLSIEIPLPPLTEQRRLVMRIEELAAKVEEAKGLREKADEEHQFLASLGMKESRLELLRQNHEVASLGEITKVTSGGTPSRDNPAFWNGTIPWIKTGELIDGDIEKTDEYITEAAVENSSAKLFPKETILVALYGQGQTRGRTGRLLIPCATNQACAAILPCERLRPRYIQYWLRTLYREMREDNHGGAQPNWSGQMIKDILIAVPSLQNQDRLVEHLDKLTGTLGKVDSLRSLAKMELNALLPSILDRAFRGEL